MSREGKQWSVPVPKWPFPRARTSPFVRLCNKRPRHIGVSYCYNSNHSKDGKALNRNRNRSLFFCTQCGHESPKWMGFCPSCGERSPLVEAPRSAARIPSRGWLAPPASETQELSEVAEKEQPRLPLAFGELNRVLGGGIVPGSLILMAGEPGIGKSTLLVQVAGHLANAGNRVLYVSGEESAQQIKLRSQRLGVPGQGIHLLLETDVDRIVEQVDRPRPTLVMVDSIQSLYSQEVPSGPGSVAQVRECTLRLMRWAKGTGVPMVITGHVIKDGSLAGPRVLEHIVDVVLYLEGEELSSYRLLRSVKNRFGSTDEVGIFQMGSDGLEEVADPSQNLLSQRVQKSVGAAVVPVLEGSRPLLVEVQALTSPSFLPTPRRIANGVDYNRLLMLSAVLSRRVGLNLSNQDIIVSVAGGIRVREPAADAAIVLAIASSYHNVPLPQDLVALGEVGLSGELRGAPQLERRLAEATRLGFARCLLPASAQRSFSGLQGMEEIYASTVAAALSRCLPRKKGSVRSQDDPLITNKKD